MTHFLRQSYIIIRLLILIGCALQSLSVHAEPILSSEQILLYGLGLKVAPTYQPIPKDVATVVSTFLQSPTLSPGQKPPLPGNAVVKATLVGPGLPQALELQVAVNEPFQIPPLLRAGLYSLENIRVVSGNEVLFYAQPERATIEVLEHLLVTEVTTRPLTAAEIRDKGIVFDRSNFQAYNFTAAFAVEPGKEIHINFPVLLPKLAPVTGVGTQTVGLPNLGNASLIRVPTIIPDTLKQAQLKIPNLTALPVYLIPKYEGKTLDIEPIAGVIVIPGDIAFLNQYFSVMLMVGNAAPANSVLAVQDLKAEIILPSGNDGVANSNDDPLRMAMTERGESPRLQNVAGAGTDGKLGTADDQTVIAAGKSGSAEFLIEGRREGSHNLELELTGTLTGLPVGPVTVRGRAAGAVLVRNPTFTLTFTHPDIVNEGEEYDLDITVTNTSESPANFVSLDLYPQHISGAVLVGESNREIESIAPNDSATVSYRLKSLRIGSVYAATLDSDQQVQGRFLLKTSVGELGIPLSPDSLVLPKEAQSLPAELRKTIVALLGKAHAAATAPAGALPRDVKRFSKKMVWDRAVEAAEAGLRKDLKEPLADTLAHLWLDFTGNGYGRLAERYTNEDERAAAEKDFIGFDDIRRRSQRGDAFAAALAAELRQTWLTGPIGDAHRAFAEKVSFRPAHLSVVLSANGAALPYRLVLIDSEGNRLGELDEKTGKIGKAIPFSDLLDFRADGGELQGQLALVAATKGSGYTIRLERLADTPETPFDLSLVLPAGTPSGLRQVVFKQLKGDANPVVTAESGDPFAVKIEFAEAPAGAPVQPTESASIIDLPPTVLGVVQQADADRVACPSSEGVTRQNAGTQFGRVIAALFTEEVKPDSAQSGFERQNINRYAVGDNQVVGVALQPKGRIVFLALRDPVGPLIERKLGVNQVEDLRGHKLADWSGTIEATVTQAGGVVSGKVLRADGTPVAFADTRLFTWIGDCGWYGVSAKQADADGRYGWDFVITTKQQVLAIDPSSEEYRKVFFNVSRNGQRLEVNAVLLGRAMLQGRAYTEDGFTPLEGAQIKATSLNDYSSYGARTDSEGRYAIDGIPLGGVVIEAVHTATHSQRTASALLQQAGKTVQHDLILLTEATLKIIAKYGKLTGHVLETDGAAPVAGLPVIVYYKTGSQPGVICDYHDAKGFCPVAAGTTDANGAFAFNELPAGQLKVYTYDQSRLLESELLVQLPADGTAEANVLLTGGLGTVRGIVLDASGQPVAGASVGGALSLATTDTQGLFELKDVPVGTERKLTAVSQALGARGSAIVDIKAAGDVVSATIVLNGVAKVEGTIYKTDGQTPMAGLDLYLWHNVTSSSGEMAIEVVGSATTDAAGHYLMYKVPLGKDYTLSAFLPDFSDGNVESVALVANGQTVRADVVFRGKGKIKGVLYDDDGKTPLKGKVALSAPRVPAAGPVGLGFQYTENLVIADTDLGTGRFNFDGVFVGPATLTAVGPFSPDPIVSTLIMPHDGAVIEKNLQLEPNSKVAGSVYRPDGVTPAGPGVKVTFRGYKIDCSSGICVELPGGIQEETVVTDENSHYELPLVNPGKFELKAELAATVASDHVQRYGFVRATSQAGQIAEVPIRLLGMNEVRVEVYGSDGKTPVDSPTVKVQHRLVIPGTDNSLVDEGSFGMEKSGTGNAQGYITFGGGDALPEGEITVLARDTATGFAGRANARLEHDGQTVTVKVYLYNAAGVVSGTLYRPNGQEPVPNADVVVTNAQGSLAFAVTDEQGHYRVETIPLGSFRVDVFEAATGRRGYGKGAIDTAGPEVPLNITQTGMGFVTGKVLSSEDQAPLSGWPLQLVQPDPGGRTDPMTGYTISTAWKATSGLDGGFEFPGVSVGRFMLRAEKKGMGRADLESRISSEGQKVELPLIVDIAKLAEGTLAGWVYGPDGTPQGNAQVTICTPGACDFGPLAGVTTDESGAFVFNKLPLGRYVIEANAQGVNKDDFAKDIAELSFAGQTEYISLTLAGLGSISGTVLKADGTPAPGVKITLQGYGTQYAKANVGEEGRFQFLRVPSGRFTLEAEDVISGLKGMVSGTLYPDQALDGMLVSLGPSARIEGRAIGRDRRPVGGVFVELDGKGVDRILYAETDAKGRFVFAAVPPANYRLTLTDPLGIGQATQELLVMTDKTLPDIKLDDILPAVSSTEPSAGAGKVPLDQVIHISFSKPVDPATVNQNTVQLVDENGHKIAGVLHMEAGDMSATFKPLEFLDDGVRHTLRVSGGPPFLTLDKNTNGSINREEAMRYFTLLVNFEQYDGDGNNQLSKKEYPGGIEDRLGRGMSSDFAASFTTVDITPPIIVNVSPGQGVAGVAEVSVLRISYSEPIDPAKFSAPAIVLNNAQGQVKGRLDWILGNTVAVFTPDSPLLADTIYQVSLAAASDLAGNQQPQGLDYAFSTTDHTPPEVKGLSLSGNGNVPEGAQAGIATQLAAGHDVAFVDFYVNGQLLGSDRQSPFEFNFQVTPVYGQAGATISIAAVATDVSGNRGPPRPDQFIIVADTPPAVTLLTPLSGQSLLTGHRVDLSVQAIDDLGLSVIAFQAVGGQPPATGRTQLPDGTSKATEQYNFQVPIDAIPGSTITLNASAVDSREQEGRAVPVLLTVVDDTDPNVAVEGLTSGDRAIPGKELTVVVSGHDVGGIAGLTLQVEGPLNFKESRSVAPATIDSATVFRFLVPPTASAKDTLMLKTLAVDQAGNSGAGAPVILAVADIIPPAVASVSAVSNEVAPGQTVDVTVNATDDLAVSRIDLTGSGAVDYTDRKQITPASGSAQAVFSVPVPADAADDASINLTARALDTSGNISPIASLTLKVRSQVGLSLPGSVTLRAGESTTVNAHLSAPAPEGGITITLISENPDVAQLPPSIMIPAGADNGSFEVEGRSGGLAAIKASIDGVLRAGMNASVIGGIVSGTVLNEALQPVAGVDLSINGKAEKTDDKGNFLAEGVIGIYGRLPVTVHASDPDSKLKAYASGMMNTPKGYLRNLKLVLQATGVVSGVALKADVQTPAGAGVRVDLFKPNHDESAQPLQTVWTQDAGGLFELPAVPIGQYELEISDTIGNHGRTEVSLDKSSQLVQTSVAYLGLGTVIGQVVDAQGKPVPNFEARFTSSSVFGIEHRQQTFAGGQFHFDHVFVGQASASARDQNTQLGASAGGKLTQDGQTLELTLKMGKWGAIEGKVYRADGATTVANAKVQAGSTDTTTDTDGFYRLELLPLGKQVVRVEDKAGRGLGKAEITLEQHGKTKPLDVHLLGQGTLVVRVKNANGQPVTGALLTAKDAWDLLWNLNFPISGKTDNQGRAILERLNEGQCSVDARIGELSGTVSGTLAANEVRELTVTLEPAGTITGTVHDPEGKPLKGVMVRLLPGGRSATTGEDGAFRFDGLRLLEYELDGYYKNIKRARATGLKLEQPNQVLVRDLTLVGLGTVTGRVTAPTGYDASNLMVTLQSRNPDFARTLTGRTNAAGYYSIEQVPVGPFTLSTGDAAKQLYGEASGEVQAHGETVTADFALTANVVALPKNLYDGNGVTFDVQTDGTLANGLRNLFTQLSTYQLKGGEALEIVADGQTYAFDGGLPATQENFGRELVVRQNGLGGINVTRKIYVPQEGYFARYLEVLSNPGDQPVTVGVKVVNHYMNSDNSIALLVTSSGDNQLNAQDSWLTLDDSKDEDPFDTGSKPAAASIWAGADAILPPDETGYSAWSSKSTPTSTSIGWQAVTVPPGESVALMHFVVQQISRAAAQASAERLAQLPPEALAGMSPGEMAAVRNFAIPEDGSSPLSSLPRLIGEISGRILASDRLTPPPSDLGGQVRFQSENIFFGRTFDVRADAGTGYFEIKPMFTGGSQTHAIPIDRFKLTSFFSAPANVFSPLVEGSFPTGQTHLEQDLVFDNTGILQGIVREASGSNVPDTHLTVQYSDAPKLRFKQDSQADGAYRFAFLPEGTFEVSVEKSHPQGSPIQAKTTTSIAAGKQATLDLNLPPVGSITGRLVNAQGVVIVNCQVRLNAGSSWSRSTPSDTAGQFTLTQVPVGNYQLKVVDPDTGYPFSRNVTVAADQTLTTDVQLPWFVRLPAAYMDGGGFHWRIYNYGGRIDGENLAYAGSGQGLWLKLGNDYFNAGPPAIADKSERELIIGPQMADDIAVSRKVFVPQDDTFIRFLDVFENLGSSDVSLQVELSSRLGSANATEIVQTSTGDLTFDRKDRYIVTDGADGTGSPAMLHLFAGQNARIRPTGACSPCSSDKGALRYSYTLNIPAGKRVILLHFAAQKANRAASAIQADRLYWLEGSSLSGLSRDEQEDIVNFNAFPDADHDVLPDEQEFLAGTNPGIQDSDNDGLRDGFEYRNGFNPLVPDNGLLDSDNDGLNNLAEQAAETDPTNPDSDGDGLKDGFEAVNSFDPLIPGEQDQDSDADGLDNLAEQAAGTNPRQADTDNDGLKDKFEVANGFDPIGANEANLDTDNDGLNNLAEQAAGTDPRKADTDGDGLKDSFEKTYGFNPLLATDEQNRDTDSDGLNNLAEQTVGTHPLKKDSDNDGLGDGDEVNVHKTGPLNPDTDGGGVSDGIEVLSAHTNPLDAADDVGGIRLTNDRKWSQQVSSTLDKQGNLHVVWVKSIGGNTDIFYTLLGPHGQTLIDDTPITRHEGRSDYAENPDVALDSRNHVHIVWQDTPQRYEIFHTVIDPARHAQDGSAGDAAQMTLVGEHRVSTLDSRDSERPRLAIDKHDLVHLVWIDEYNEIRYIRLDDAGNVLLAERVIHPAGAENISLLASIVVDSENDVHLAWSSGSDKLYYQMLDGDTGATLIGETVLSTGWSYPLVSLAVTPGNEVAIVFDQYTGNKAYEVYMLRVDPHAVEHTGQAADPTLLTVFPKTLITPEGGIDSFVPSVSVDAFGKLHVPYFENWKELDNHGELHLRVIDTSGKTLKHTSVTSGSTAAWPSGYAEPAAVAARGSATYVVWPDDRFGNPDLLLRIIDADADGDGANDQDELAAGTNLTIVDSDGDGLLDGFELDYGLKPLDAGDGHSDPDGDGLDNLAEQASATDPKNSDSDQDGLNDGEELSLGTNPGRADSDGDGIPDGEEVHVLHTNPFSEDSDGDGLKDKFERQNGLNPIVAGEQHQDPDGDGLDNLAEQASGTDPKNPDSDQDSLNDGAEVKTWHTNPLDADSDDDGLRDGFETQYGFDPLRAGEQGQDTDNDGLTNLAEQTAGTDPKDQDSDDDGLLDGFEVTYGFDPKQAGEAVMDPDGDGLTNIDEQSAHTNPLLPDSDKDGLSDGDEVQRKTNPLNTDSDRGGAMDGKEVKMDHTNPLDPSDDLVIGQ